MLLHAILDYGENGVEPNFPRALGAVWAMLKPKLDRDSEAYSEKCRQNARNALIPSWKRYAEENGLNPSDREARESWIDVQLARNSERKRTPASACECDPTITITPIQTETVTPIQTETITEAVTPIQTEVISGASAAPAPTSQKKRTVFEKPDFEAVKDYFHEIGSASDPQGFYDYYESNGWKVGRNQMKDWKAAARNWTKRDRGQSGYSVRPSQESTVDRIERLAREGSL